jgi:hypothetical protein
MHPAVILEDHQGFEGFATCDRHVFVAVVKMVVFLSLAVKNGYAGARCDDVCRLRFEPQRPF